MGVPGVSRALLVLFSRSSGGLPGIRRVGSSKGRGPRVIDTDAAERRFPEEGQSGLVLPPALSLSWTGGLCQPPSVSGTS